MERDVRGAAGLRFIERCATLSSVPAVVDEFCAAIRNFGFSASACGAWAGSGRARVTRFFFRDWPQDWIDRYDVDNFAERDALALEARRRLAPFIWRDVAAAGNGAALAFLSDARLNGWVDGLVVPIHGPGGYLGIVSLSSSASLELGPAERAILQAMSLAVHDRCRRAESESGSRPVKLTRREIECLRWVAVGKSDREIAGLLGISAATAHFHVEQGKRKLEVPSRAQAVALLVLAGAI